MRVLKRNETPMKYALYLGSRPVYEYYDDEEGNSYPMDTGEKEDVYGCVGDFSANISKSNDKGNATEYGMSIADFSAILITDRGYPFKKGDYLWVESPVEYKDDGKEIDVTLKNGETIRTKVAVVESADYQVVGTPDSLDVGKILLKSVNK